MTAAREGRRHTRPNARRHTSRIVSYGLAMISLATSFA